MWRAASRDVATSPGGEVELERFVAATFAVGPASLGVGGDRAGPRAAMARSALEEILSVAVDEEGAFRMMRARARLSGEGLERLQSGLAGLLAELHDEAAPEVELALILGRRA